MHLFSGTTWILCRDILFFDKNEEFMSQLFKLTFLDLLGSVYAYIILCSTSSLSSTRNRGFNRRGPASVRLLSNQSCVCQRNLLRSHEERKQAISKTLDENNFCNVFVIAGTGAQSTRETKKLYIDAKEAGATFDYFANSSVCYNL